MSILLSRQSIERQSVDVVLVRPQEHDYDYLQWHEDLGVGHILRELRDAGLRTRVFDHALRPILSRDAYTAAVHAIDELQPRIVCVVIDKHPTNSPYYAGLLIKKLKAETSVEHVTIYGNTQVGALRLLDEFAVDSVIVGEEREARLLAEAVVNGHDFGSLPGIVARTQDGSIVENKPLPLHPEFYKSPPPSRYFFELPEIERNPFGYVAAIEASRGCYAKCTFCYIRSKDRTYGNYGWIGRRPSAIVDEMETLYSRYSAREFSFVDPQFIGPGERGQEWAREIASEILQRNLRGISFSIYARANDMQRHTIELLKEAGLYAVFIGIESFSDAVLKRYRKGVTVAQNLRAIHLLMDLDVRLRMGFVSFDHETTVEELSESACALEELLKYKPHLITQPVFFQNILAPLDDTPAGDHYRTIGAAKMAVAQPPELQLLAKRQERLTRGGPITTFRNPHVTKISDMTRILAGEITQRSTWLEIACTSYLASRSDSRVDSIDLEGEAVPPRAALAWLNSLTTFAITEFAQLVRHFGNNHVIGRGEFDNYAVGLRERMRDYDNVHLGTSLPRSENPDGLIVD